jgi:hypothetical protein
MKEDLCITLMVYSLYQALRCIGDLIAGHPKNLDILASKVLGTEPQVEPAMNSILRILLRTSSMQEFIAADYIFKNFCEVAYFIRFCLCTLLLLDLVCVSFVLICFCLFVPSHLNQKNADGQTMLASTLTPQPHSMTQAPLEEDVNMSFGRFVCSVCIEDCILPLISLF